MRITVQESRKSQLTCDNRIGMLERIADDLPMSAGKPQAIIYGMRVLAEVPC
jgi:hypothetical protein